MDSHEMQCNVHDFWVRQRNFLICAKNTRQDGDDNFRGRRRCNLKINSFWNWGCMWLMPAYLMLETHTNHIARGIVQNILDTVQAIKTEWIVRSPGAHLSARVWKQVGRHYQLCTARLAKTKYKQPLHQSLHSSSMTLRLYALRTHNRLVSSPLPHVSVTLQESESHTVPAPSGRRGHCGCLEMCQTSPSRFNISQWRCDNEW